MKKILMGGLFAILLSLSIGTTTVYAESAETSETVSEMESIEDSIVNENSSEINESVNQTVNETEESALQKWFDEHVMPFLGTAIASTGTTATILVLIFKALLSRVEKKLKEAYDKKSEAEKQEYDFNTLMTNFTGTINQTIETLKAVFETKGETLEETTKVFAEKYVELQAQITEMVKVINQVTSSNTSLQETVKTENDKLHALMQAEQSEMKKLSQEDMKLITDILLIAYTNNPHLVSNGYATAIKETVETYEKSKE